MKAGGPSRFEEPAVFAYRAVSAMPGKLDDGTPSACGEVNHQQDNADDEEDPRDLRRNRRNASGSENAGNQSDHEKYESVIQHSNTSLSLRNKAEDVPFWLVLTDQSFDGSSRERHVADRCMWSKWRLCI